MSNATTIRVLVLTDSKDSAAFLPSLLGAEPGVEVKCAGMAYGEGLRAVASQAPDVVVLSEVLDDPVLAVEELDQAAPQVPVLIVLPEGQAKLAQQCTLAGARATMLKPFDRESLVDAVVQLHQRELRRRERTVASAQAQTGGRRARPRVIAVHGTKGGVGATTVACNLAAALRASTGKRVGIVDADVLNGSVGVLFDLAPMKSLADLADQRSMLPGVMPSHDLADLAAHATPGQALDADLLDGVLVEHSSGVKVALAPEQLAQAETLGGEDIHRVLTGLKPHFDYLVVDTPAQITPVTLAALDEADRIVLVLTPEVSALRNAARFLRLASQLGYVSEKVSVVLNRATSSKDIGVSAVEEHLQRRVSLTLPSDETALVQCHNMGELLVSARPGHRAAQGLVRFARETAAALSGVPVSAKAPKVASRPAVAVAGPVPMPALSPADGARAGLAAAALNAICGLAALAPFGRRRQPSATVPAVA